jgi:hypothetical protein
MKGKRMKINQIGITIYDNKPNLPANKWYDITDVKDSVTNRYKIELNFLHKGSPIKLRSSLNWPPSQLRRLSYWNDHLSFYEDCVKQAEDINRQIRSGQINARVPALIAIPNMNESFMTGDKKRHFKWKFPEMPSVVIATRQHITAEKFQWHLQWIAKDFKETFVIDHTCTAEDIAGRKGASLRVNKGFPGPYNLDDKLITGRDDQITYMNPKLEDAEYTRFKQQVKGLLMSDSVLNKMTANELCNKYPEFAARFVSELPT